MFVDSLIHHAMRMRQLSSVASPALQYFSTLFHKRRGFRGKKVKQKVGELIFTITFVWNIYHYELREIHVLSQMWIGLRVKYV
jgi:hypothetical protein